MMDPVTGGTICSCQLKSGLPAYLSRVPSLPETMYSAAYNQLPQTFTMGTDTPTAFYPLVSFKDYHDKRGIGVGKIGKI